VKSLISSSNGVRVEYGFHYIARVWIDEPGRIEAAGLPFLLQSRILMDLHQCDRLKILNAKEWGPDGVHT
jgi:hypothetical protein